MPKLRAIQPHRQLIPTADAAVGPVFPGDIFDATPEEAEELVRQGLAEVLPEPDEQGEN